MIINEKQLQILLIILKDSVSMNISGLFSFTHDARMQILNDIINQQSQELKEIK